MAEWNLPGVGSQTNVFDWHDFYLVILCPYCDGQHFAEKCPRIKEIEYYPDGKIKRVKLQEYQTAISTSPYKFPETTAE